MNLACLENKNVAGNALEGLAVYRPDPASLADELNLVIRMAMRTRSGAGFAVEEVNRNAGVPWLAPMN